MEKKTKDKVLASIEAERLVTDGCKSYRALNTSWFGSCVHRKACVRAEALSPEGTGCTVFVRCNGRGRLTGKIRCCL